MTYKGLGSRLSSRAYPLRVGGRVVGQIDPLALCYQTSAHWYAAHPKERPVIVLGPEEYAALLEAGIETIEYIAQTTPRVWRAKVGDHRSIQTPKGPRWAVHEDDLREVPPVGGRT